MRPLVALALSLWAVSARAEDARFALVIGHNHSDDPALTPLRYADDDALRYHELLTTVTERAILLASPDTETRTLFGAGLASSSLPPTRAEVFSAVATLRDDIAQARARGARPVLYVVYSGHGHYDADGRGYLHLADGRLTTRDLYSRVLEPTRDALVVLIIDACNAGLMVNGRGPAESTAERRPPRASRLDLSHFPNVGVVLAHSAQGETHEWGRFLAGVFSHEVRSALYGAADLNDDQRIGFAELAAFVASANARVRNPTVRITPYIRPPLAAPDLPVIDLSRARARGRLRIEGLTGKAHLVDQDLVRYADFHRTATSPPFWLTLTRPGELTVATEHGTFAVAEHHRGDVAWSQLERRAASSVTARGPGSDYLERTLFHEPYDRDVADLYLRRDYLDHLTLTRITEAPWWEHGAAWATLSAGLATLGGGLALNLHAQDLASRAFASPWANHRARLNDEAHTHATASYVLWGLGGAAVLTSVLLFSLDAPTRTETYRPPLAVDLDPSGVRLRSTW